MTYSPPPVERPASPRREALVAVLLLVAGLLVGGVWALLAPSLARSADLGESHVAVDGLLALLGLGAGLVTGVVLSAAPGQRPVLRLALVLAAATAANLIAAGVGLVRGLSLGAPGVALLWPLTTAVVTALRTLASMVVSPDDDGDDNDDNDGNGGDKDDSSRAGRRHAGVSGPPEP